MRTIIFCLNFVDNIHGTDNEFHILVKSVEILKLKDLILIIISNDNDHHSQSYFYLFFIVLSI